MSEQLRQVIVLASGWAAGTLICLNLGKNIDEILREQSGDKLAKIIQARGFWALTASIDQTLEKMAGKHFSLRCIRLSIGLSVCSVVVVSLLTYGIVPELWKERVAHAGVSFFWAAAGLVLVLNLVPDWISLLETRVVLRLLRRLKNPVAKLVLIPVDLCLTATVFGVFLWLADWLMSGFSGGMGFGEVIEVTAGAAQFWKLGPDAIFAIPFYSTFGTSAWVWVFALGCLGSKYVPAVLVVFDVERFPTRVAGLLGWWVISTPVVAFLILRVLFGSE